MIDERIHFHTYDHNFGIVIPRESGFCWKQQTEGVACHHVEIEGIFLPLPKPDEILERIQNANYRYKTDLVLKYWKELKVYLKDHCSLEFEEIVEPLGLPHNQEGLQWIKITKWDDYLGQGEKLVGQVVALYYPNCD